MNVNDYRRPQVTRIRQVSLRDVYHYFHYRHRVPLLPLRPFLERLLPLHCIEPDPLWKYTLQRYNDETTAHERMQVLYELLMFAPCPICHSFPCH